MCGIHFENLYESLPSLFWLGILIEVYVAVRWTNMMFVDKSALKWHCADWFLNILDMVELPSIPIFSMWNVTNQWGPGVDEMDLGMMHFPPRWVANILPAVHGLRMVELQLFFPFGSVNERRPRDGGEPCESPDSFWKDGRRLRKGNWSRIVQPYFLSSNNNKLIKFIVT